MSDLNPEAEAASADARALAIRAAVAKLREILQEHTRAQQEAAHAAAAMERAQAHIAETIEKYKQLVAIGPLFGFDLDHEYVQDEARQNELLEGRLTPRPFPEQAMTAATIAASEKPKPTIREWVIAAAQESYPNPVRASVLRRQLELSGARVHDKTVGMTLYRLLRAGVLRRDGWDWFFVPEDQRHTAAVAPQDEESPGDDPGLLLEAAQ